MYVFHCLEWRRGVTSYELPFCNADALLSLSKNAKFVYFRCCCNFIGGNRSNDAGSSGGSYVDQEHSEIRGPKGGRGGRGGRGNRYCSLPPRIAIHTYYLAENNGLNYDGATTLRFCFFSRVCSCLYAHPTFVGLLVGLIVVEDTVEECTWRNSHEVALA